MTSITTFAYGLTVRTTGLLTAAHAWPSLEPTFAFFDLLFLRKKKGTLQGRLSGSTREDIIGKVPVEVWEEIRKWVVVIEMEDKEDKLLARFWWPMCSGQCALCERGRYTWKGLYGDAVDKTNERWLSNDVEFEDFLRGFIAGLGDSLEPLHRFLAHFGLAHPLTRMITYSHKYRELNAVALVSLPI